MGLRIEGVFYLPSWRCSSEVWKLDKKRERNEFFFRSTTINIPENTHSRLDSIIDILQKEFLVRSTLDRVAAIQDQT